MGINAIGPRAYSVARHFSVLQPESDVDLNGPRRNDPPNLKTVLGRFPWDISWPLTVEVRRNARPCRKVSWKDLPRIGERPGAKAGVVEAGDKVRTVLRKVAGRGNRASAQQSSPFFL